MTTYRYKLEPRIETQNFAGVGTVWFEDKEEVTEHKNIFLPRKCIGGYVLNVMSNTINIHITTDKYFGEVVSCRYHFKSCKDIWYLSGYDNYSIIDSISIVLESTETDNYDKAYLIKE